MNWKKTNIQFCIACIPSLQHFCCLSFINIIFEWNEMERKEGERNGGMTFPSFGCQKGRKKSLTFCTKQILSTLERFGKKTQ